MKIYQIHFHFIKVFHKALLGPLLFILYMYHSTPLSSLISDSSVKHQLYADDTQLFISFSALGFTLNITQLDQDYHPSASRSITQLDQDYHPSASRSTSLNSTKTTIDDVSAWMSANLLSLNQSKTEFLLIGLLQQLSKVYDPTLYMPSKVTIMPTNSARNLGVIFDSSLTFSEHTSSESKSCFLFIRDLRRIRNTPDYSSAQTIAIRLSFIPRSTTVTLSFSILHLFIVGSLVHSTWLYSHFASLSLSLYHSYHLISSAIRPTIVQWCLRISLHWVFTLAWLAFTGTLNVLTHLRYFFSSHLLICKYFLSFSFHFVRKSLSLSFWPFKHIVSVFSRCSLLTASLSLCRTTEDFCTSRKLSQYISVCPRWVRTLQVC